MATLRRRDLLRALAGGAGLLALVKVGGRAVIGPALPARALDPARLTTLSPRQEAIVTAAALAMVGTPGRAAYAAGDWDPALAFDAMLGEMPRDQRKLAGVSLHLLEEWGWGLSGFSSLAPDEAEARLAAWRTSDLALHRTVWALLHALCTAPFASSEAGLAALGHPGPCVASPGHPGRPPGQSALFEWDPLVP